jgi:ppGpp synthetase/RelA/SpoT-type nucleotidyltranferase
MEDLDQVRQRWLSERPSFEQFGQALTFKLQNTMRAFGFPAAVSCRTKEVDSLIKKLITKSDHHTYESLPDKLGLRIVVKRKRHVEIVCASIANEFACDEFDDKIDKLKENQVGYLGKHVNIWFRPEDPGATKFPIPAFKAELQIRTLAQNLWSEMSHGTTYKGGEAVKLYLRRRVHLLAALIEVADNEFEWLDEEIGNLPDMPELTILRALERHYYTFTSRAGDAHLSLEVIRLLWPLYEKSPEQISAHFDQVFTAKAPFLAEVFRIAEAGASDSRSAFFFQPESLLIYDLLESMEYRLRQTWAQSLPEPELERIAIAFGFSFV